MTEGRQWYWADGDIHHGPFTEVEMLGLLSAGEIRRETRVSRQGAQHWVQAMEVEASWRKHARGPTGPAGPADLPPMSARHAAPPRGPNHTLLIVGIGVVLLVAVVIVAVVASGDSKYSRRAKTTEAIDQLDKIYKGAAVYYTTPRVEAVNHTRVPCQFPATVAITPLEGTCCNSQGGPDMDGDDRCDSDPDAWEDLTWRELLFQLNDQHYFVYGFESAGDLDTATFTASAYGDLDCDGIQSTFQRAAFGDPQATLGECSVVGSPAFFVDQETE